MLRYEEKKLDEISGIMGLHRVSITQMCRRYREQGLEEYARNKFTALSREYTASVYTTIHA